MLSLLWQQSFWSAPASFRMTRPRVGVAAATGVEAFTAGQFMQAVSASPAGDMPAADMRPEDMPVADGYHPVARTAVRRGVYGAAAVGAAAAGAYGYYGGGYGSGCRYNSYGAWVCPGQYGY